MRAKIANAPLAVKIGLIPAIATAGFFVIAVLLFLGAIGLRDRLTDLAGARMPNSAMATQISENLGAAHISLFRAIVWRNSGLARAKIEIALDEAKNNLQTALSLTKQLEAVRNPDPDEAVLFARLARTEADYLRQRDELIALGDDTAQALAKMTEIDRTFQNLRWQIGDIATEEMDRASEASLSANQELRRLMIKVLLVLVGLGGPSIAIFVIIIRMISRPIQAVTRAMSEVAAGRRDVVIPTSSGNDEVGVMARTLATSLASIIAAESRLQLAASVFTHTREGIVITDTEGGILEVNDAFCRLTGYERSEVIGQNTRILNSGRQSADYYDSMWKALIEKGFWDGEIWNRRKNGEIYAEMLTISAVRDTAGKTQSYVALFSDITTIKEHQQKLESIAHYDPLTGLPNRTLLADRLQQSIARTQRRRCSLGVLFIDLDGFKAVNDTHGHDHGDMLLVTVAQRMKGLLRDGDTLARIGGDEFVAVLTDLERTKDCESLIHRLLTAAATPVVVGSREMQVSASIGVTFFPEDEGDPDLLLRHADQAMYVAKQSGKNGYHLFDIHQDSVVKTQRVELDRIRFGLAAGEFELHYQPKVNLKTGQILGVEALIRWQNPERGLLLPADFLPLIEGQSLGDDVGEWVLNSALNQMEQWQQLGLCMPVSVNIAAAHLQRSDFAEKLKHLLVAHSEIDGSKLEIEILETGALADMAKTGSIMQACQKLGVRFALDDFGTGYSSLAYLRHLPAALIKIDQSFVRDMLDDPSDLAIVSGVIGLAGAFGREVIAEGVETAQHGARLLELGCPLAQGYAIARPMPASALPVWVSNWRPDPAWSSVTSGGVG